MRAYVWPHDEKYRQVVLDDKHLQILRNLQNAFREEKPLEHH